MQGAGQRRSVRVGRQSITGPPRGPSSIDRSSSPVCRVRRRLCASTKPAVNTATKITPRPPMRRQSRPAGAEPILVVLPSETSLRRWAKRLAAAISASRCLLGYQVAAEDRVDRRHHEQCHQGRRPSVRRSPRGRAERSARPLPSASAIGSIPRTIASAVIMTGRKRCCPPRSRPRPGCMPSSRISLAKMIEQVAVGDADADRHDRAHQRLDVDRRAGQHQHPEHAGEARPAPPS